MIKLLKEKHRREQENIHIEKLAELVSARPSDMSLPSCKTDKCVMLKETINQICTQKTSDRQIMLTTVEGPPTKRQKMDVAKSNGNNVTMKPLPNSCLPSNSRSEALVPPKGVSNHIKTIQKSIKKDENKHCEELQQSKVPSSKPTNIDDQVLRVVLKALDSFLFIVNTEGNVEFVSENISNFLKFREDEIFEKDIYGFIHPDDHSIFSSNLLLMMPLGNWGDWSVYNNCKSNKQATNFTCRFLGKREEPKIKMKNKVPQQNQYTNLNITAHYIPLDNGTEEPRIGITCIARRAALEEKG